MQLRHLVLAGLAAAGLMSAADPAYFGKWKLDPIKSDFGDTTITISKTGSGELEYFADGQAYTFKTDGKDYPALFGGTAAWKSIDSSTWEATNKLNGKLLGTDTYQLSPDGNSLTVHSQGPKPAGGAFDDTIAFQRVSGTSGIAGKWKTKVFKSNSPGTLELLAPGPDKVKFTLIDEQAVCSARFDGNDYPLTGPTLPPNFTMAFQKAGANGFSATVKQAGKALYQSAFTVSADGLTLTESGSAVATGEKYKAVYNRQ